MPTRLMACGVYRRTWGDILGVEHHDDQMSLGCPCSPLYLVFGAMDTSDI